MWILTLRSPTGEPREYALKAGKMTIGRKPDNDIVIADESASRLHAEIQYNAEANIVILRDLGSTNGTFLNRERLTQSRALKPGDQFRIGQLVASVAYRDHKASADTAALAGTQPLTRDLLLEAVDQHAVLLFEVARRLNTIIDLETGLQEVSALLQRAMGADKCDVILAERFNQLAELGFPTSIARQAIDQRSAVVVPDLSEQADQVGKSGLLLRIRSVMCVPILSGEEIVGLVYVYRTGPHAQPFDPRDLQLAVGISHQAAMTIQRTRLLKRVRQGDRISNFFQRFLSPREAEFLLQEYLRTGQLPGLTEQILTVLFADIRDSTGMAERLGARRFGEILSRYYEEMTRAIFDQNGMLNKYLGDGVMAVFGALGRPDPEARAVRVALNMLERIDNINRAEYQQIELAIGINTGVVAAGYVGTDERVEYTVLGDMVNIAQRLERHAHHNRIFIGPDTCQAVVNQFRTRYVGPVEMRGRTQPIDAFEVLRD